MTIRLAVLVSGRGSNLQALLDAIAAGALDAQVVGVFSDRVQAPALAKVAPAQRWSAAPSGFPNRAAFDQALGDAVAAVQPDWIVCAGYMRILGASFVQRFAGRLLNIHPSLLPKYRGLHTHAQALAAGDAEHGASVHFVVPELDAGAVIAQARVPVQAGDRAEDLAQRLLPREHALLCAVLQLAAAGRLAERDGSVWLDGQCRFSPLRLDCQGMLIP
ncbi:phosphoribosylglycinamide formyltransferase [Xanthomonas graminis]|jgi:phosphoribosylglycinamide formyltransferase-1|uniref:Phosphoribosylglycinamide formyltransferase n=2 Tax=Xanthomonas translucens group TaxID=3390202 RepID=A0A1M4IH58_9XANT|nr:phosphoribosylglycinamide formyltransferase [Xanthomonas translucens]OAX62350.1 phosphoribosylglycinamide formyltransferase [Xanthomonas translucens pv. graminis]WIH07627.1 phosphoribosylglycinamide formyltransferase [Xanthomonas translucens pv. graminis]WIH11050.1 phosphoribosylglycinamide formyltransferase [Xanthomonas translucens pv. graminis]WIH17225.1 phosphoribosylglycinamide formyltransferase [Xanthomonas translucens pv. graminis]SBV40865.1 phosphoribosylglycinamide formyltransferase